MEGKYPSNELTPQKATISQLNSEELQKYDKICTKYPAILSITNPPPLPDVVLYVPNSASNPLQISDDSEDEDEHPFVVLRPLEPSDKEPAWDQEELQTQKNDEDRIDITKSSTSSDSEECTTTEYSTDGGFVIDDGDKEVFLHHHDPDFDPNTESTSDTSAVGDKGILQANCDGTDDEKESPPAKRQRRGRAEF